MIRVPTIVSIVEGKAESKYHAVPILVRRIAEEMGLYVDCYKTERTGRDTFPRFRDVRERVVISARAQVGEYGGILVVLDSDGEPPYVNRSHHSSPCLLGTDLLEAIRPVAAGLPIAVVMADREYEAWFLSAAPSLVGEKGLRDGVMVPDNPDQVRDPKRWLTEHMDDPTQAYSPTADQARFTAHFDMAMARDHSPSFDAAYRAIEQLIREVTERQSSQTTPG
jgi:hypothetical protein